MNRLLEASLGFFHITHLITLHSYRLLLVVLHYPVMHDAAAQVQN